MSDRENENKEKVYRNENFTIQSSFQKSQID